MTKIYGIIGLLQLVTSHKLAIKLQIHAKSHTKLTDRRVCFASSFYTWSVNVFMVAKNRITERGLYRGFRITGVKYIDKKVEPDNLSDLEGFPD